ncbi:DUF3180 domain-containing protein [Cellulomonas sp. RIT-PI-Y]|uniref:DUF3180 domain-containing protein n=1 Tax=Cellulomonas sp. RIT-PI-Y TaxID=3035297 RepID=UPI0021DA55A5|nr:DUF3180 domain-containing protein [Cellulomonas sp. RIT-PI-Y]
MQRTRIGSLLLVAALTAAAAWAVIRALFSQGVLLPAVPWVTGGVLVFIAAIVFWLGWTVRQYLHGDRPGLDPLRAARTAVLAKACCYAGALLAGWYLAQVLHALTELTGEVLADRAWSAGLAVLGAVVLAAAGLLVEWFCRIPPPDDPEEHEHALGPAAS